MSPRTAVPLLLAVLAANAAPLRAAVAPVPISTGRSFVVSLPALYEIRESPEINLDILGWELKSDHSVAGAIWHMNPEVFQRYNGSAEAALIFLRSTHRCGDMICGSTPITAYEMPDEGVFFYYELQDPSIPSDRGVLSGILRLGMDFYRVQGVNYAEKNGTRGDLFRILHSVRPATPAEAAARPVKLPAPSSGGEWGIRFSGESDISLMQDMDSAQTVTFSPPQAQRSLSSAAAPSPPAPKPASAPPPAAASKRPLPAASLAAGKRRPETLKPPAAAPKPALPKPTPPAAAPAPKRTAPAAALVAAPRKAPETLAAAPPPPKPARRATKAGKVSHPNTAKTIASVPAAKPAARRESFPKLTPIAPRESPPPRAAPIIEDLDERLLHDPLPDLIELLRHENPRVRARAADILGERGEAAGDAVPRLILTLDDKDARVRSSAALALGNIGPKARPAVEKLRRLAHDRNADASLSARTALERLDGR